MNRSVFVPVLLGLGLSVLLVNASCSDICGSAAECGDENANAGAAGSGGGATTCPQLTALTDCLEAFCASAQNPFCTCYTQKKDLSSACTCVPVTLDPEDYCKAAAANGYDAASFDCAAATDGVKTMCIGVP